MTLKSKDVLEKYNDWLKSNKHKPIWSKKDLKFLDKLSQEAFKIPFYVDYVHQVLELFEPLAKKKPKFEITNDKQRKQTAEYFFHLGIVSALQILMVRAREKKAVKTYLSRKEKELHQPQHHYNWFTENKGI